MQEPATASDSFRRSRVGPGEVIVLGVLLALAASLRHWKLQAQSFTMDEITELGIAKLSLSQIATTTDGFPPLYHTVLHGWLAIAGSDAAARWLSVFFGVATVWAMWGLARELAGPKAGLVAAGFLAIAPLQIFHSQEARAYAPYIFLIVLGTWRFFRARRTGAAADWVWFGATAVLGLYTHYYYSLFVVGLLLTVALEGGGRGHWGRMLVTLVGVAVVSLPLRWLAWYDLQPHIAPDREMPVLNLASLAYTLVTLLGGYSVGPSLRELHVTDVATAARSVLPWALPMMLAAGTLGLLALSGQRARSAWQLLVVLIVPMVLCGAMGAAFDVGYRVRYVSWGTAPLVAIMALGAVAPRAGWKATLAGAAVTALSLVSAYSRHTMPKYANEDVRAAAQWLSTHANLGGPVYVSSGYMAEPLAYYFRDEPTPQPLPMIRNEQEAAAVADSIAGAAGQQFWLVYSRPFHDDPNGLLLEQLKAQSGLRLEATWPGVAVYQGGRP